MSAHYRSLRWLAALAVWLVAPYAGAETRLLRFPDICNDRVVFTYGGDLWTVSAQGADLPYGSRGPYTVNQPLNAYSWAGPYLGGNIGYAWGSVDNNPTRPSGFAGGVQGGYNWQNGPFVFGLVRLGVNYRF